MLIKDYQKLKADENSRLSLEWNVNRVLSKLNYKIHTDAIKENLISNDLSKKEMSITYANEADVLTVALFGITAKEWRIENPDLKTIAIRTVIWVLSVVFLTVIISLPLAQLINQNFPGRKFVRWAMIVPWAASVVMTSIIWKWMLELTSGEFNLTLRQLGIQHGQPVDWLRDPRFSFYVLIWVAVFVF